MRRGTLPVSVKNRNEYSDYDYVESLPAKERLWLKGFHKEYLQADLKKAKLFKSKKKRKAVFDMNNARNRDLYSWATVRGLLYLGKNVEVQNSVRDSYEEALIQLLDRGKK